MKTTILVENGSTRTPAIGAEPRPASEGGGITIDIRTGPCNGIHIILSVEAADQLRKSLQQALPPWDL